MFQYSSTDLLVRIVSEYLCLGFPRRRFRRLSEPQEGIELFRAQAILAKSPMS